MSYRPIEITPDLLEEKTTTKKAPPVNYAPANDVEKDIVLAMEQLTARGIDLTSDYSEWVKMGFAFASLGESGRAFFQQVSNLYAGYDYQECDQQFDISLKKYDGRIQVASFFQSCKDAGIDLNFKSYQANAEPGKEKSGFENNPRSDSSNTPPAEDEEPKVNESYVFTGEDLLNSPIDVMPTLWDPIFPQKGLGALGGSSDTGKSTFLRQFAIAICAGDKSFCGYPLNARHNSAILALTEDDDVAVRYLLNKQNQGLGHAPEAYRNLRFIFNSENLIAKLEKELQQRPADLVVIDAFSDLYDGEMNAGNKVRGFLNKYKERIADPFNCLVLFLHHTGKKTDDSPPSKHNLIGSQAFEAKMRVVAELRKDLNNPDYRHLCIVKGNYLPAEYKDQSYELQFDTNMIFRYTGVRVPFEQLANTEQNKGGEDNKLEKVALAFKMHKAGHKHEDIAVAVGVAGKGTISKWLNNDKYKHLFD